MNYSLKPCPFCGGEAELWYTNPDSDKWDVHCSDCGIGYGEFIHRDSAIIAWNQRSYSVSVPADVKEAAIGLRNTTFSAVSIHRDIRYLLTVLQWIRNLEQGIA